VIVHGWNITDSNELQPWTIDIAWSITKRENYDVNILAWNWMEDAKEKNGAPRNIKKQATLLVQSLHNLFSHPKISYSQPIHLIGHSFGAHLVAWYVIAIINNHFGPYTVSQVSLLDPPIPSFVLARFQTFIPDISEPIEKINNDCVTKLGYKPYIELYDGTANIGNHSADLFVDVPYQRFPGHDVDVWYKDTIWQVGEPHIVNPVLTDKNGNEIVGKTVGYGTSDPEMRPDPNCTQECTIRVQKTVEIQYVGWISGNDRFEQLEKCGDCSISLQSDMSELFIVDQKITGAGNVDIEGNSAFIWHNFKPKTEFKDDKFVTTLTFPLIVGDWDYFSFDYEFTTNSETAQLTCEVETPKQHYSVLTVTPTALIMAGSSGLLPVSQLRGQEVKLIYTFESAELVDGVYIRNLTTAHDISHGNLPPIANAGPDANYQAGKNGFASIVLDGSNSSDPESGPLWFKWTESENYVSSEAVANLELPVGSYTFTLEVRDEFGVTDTDEVTIVVIKTSSTIIFIRGDANRDSRIDIADPVKILYYLFADESVTCLDACDVNDSGLIDIADPIYELDYLFAHKNAPPIPYPEAGVDPTEDELDCVE
jgi:hypothetical protein